MSKGVKGLYVRFDAIAKHTSYTLYSLSAGLHFATLIPDINVWSCGLKSAFATLRPALSEYNVSISETIG